MKPKLILLTAAITLSIAGCKKENLAPETTLPPSQNEEADLLTDDNAEQYMVAIYGNDTVVLQDTRRMTTTLAKDNWPGLFGYGAYSASFFSPEKPNYKFKLTFRKSIS